MDRRSFMKMMAAGAAAPLLQHAAFAQVPNAQLPQARNVVLVHGLFADGSCWSEVIARLQAKGINATAVQNPLTSLADAVKATQDILALQDGPTVLVGHSFAGMIVSEAGVAPNVSSLVYVAARAPDAGEDYPALAKKYPRHYLALASVVPMVTPMFTRAFRRRFHVVTAHSASLGLRFKYPNPVELGADRLAAAAVVYFIVRLGG